MIRTSQMASFGASLGLVLGLGMTGGADSALARSKTAYPLVCRGGGNLRVTVVSKGTGSLARDVEWGGMITVYFKKAAAGAVGLSGKRLEPGECGWIDRRLLSYEPDKFCYEWMNGNVSWGVGDDGRLELWSRNSKFQWGVSNGMKTSDAKIGRYIDDLKNENNRRVFWVFADQVYDKSRKSNPCFRTDPSAARVTPPDPFGEKIPERAYQVAPTATEGDTGGGGGGGGGGGDGSPDPNPTPSSNPSGTS